MTGLMLERTGVLVIRVWFDDDSADRLRARILKTDDLFHQTETTTVSAATIEDIESAVHTWLTAFVERAGQPPQPPTS